MHRYWRRAVLMFIDVFAALLAVVISFLMRFDGAIPSDYLNTYIKALPVIVPLRVIVYHFLGLYSQIWSHASLPELLRIVWAVTVETVVAWVVIFSLTPPQGFPRSVLLIAWFLKIGLLGTIRLALRFRREWRRNGRNGRGDTTQRTLIFGAGDAGAMLAREFAKHPELGCKVVGFIDDDLNKQGLHVAGKPVLGTRTDLMQVVGKHGVTHLVIAVPSADSKVIREVVEAGRKLALHLKTLPGIFELVTGKVSVSQIRDVQIEDLLGREEIRVDLEAIAAYLTGETVLVTGAGGSIGSELCRQVASFGPQRLILVGHGENSIYEIDLELKRTFPGLEIQPVIADIQDEKRIRRVFERYRPGVVFHAAAHKHVPLMETNPEESIKNNVFGTLHVARAADFYRAKRFVLISSDKAVNPSSVMGATKRLAELVVQSMAEGSKTVFAAVRFGNVLGSRGSVIPLFKRQIAAGGPVTVTDPRMVRYFMTIPEAVQLVIQAGAMSHGGEVFVLDMGEPVRILDLAKDLIRLSGLEPDVDIPIVFSGVRSGEKLFEELLTAEEGTVATQHERIYRARGEGLSPQNLQHMLQVLAEAATGGRATNEWLRAIVQETLQADSTISAGSAP